MLEPLTQGTVLRHLYNCVFAQLYNVKHNYFVFTIKPVFKIHDSCLCTFFVTFVRQLIFSFIGINVPFYSFI